MVRRAVADARFRRATLVAVAAAALLTTGTGDGQAQEAHLTFVLAPIYDAILQRKECLPLAEFLSDRLKRRVEFKVVSDERDLEQGFAEGTYHLGLLGPGIVARTHRRRVAYTVIASQMVNKRSHHRALLLARGLEKPASLEELRGRSCAWGPASSYSLEALAAKLRGEGLDPLRSLRRRVFPRHLDALVAGVEGRYDVVAVSELTLKILSRVGKGKAELLPVLRGPRVPFDAFVVSRSLDGALREQLVLAVLSYKYFTPVDRVFIEWRPCSDDSYLRR